MKKIKLIKTQILKSSNPQSYKGHKQELPVGFLSKVETNDGYTETCSPDYLDKMLAIYEEEIATTTKPFLRVM